METRILKQANQRLCIIFYAFQLGEKILELHVEGWKSSPHIPLPCIDHANHINEGHQIFPS